MRSLGLKLYLHKSMVEDCRGLAFVPHSKYVDARAQEAQGAEGGRRHSLLCVQTSYAPHWWKVKKAGITVQPRDYWSAKSRRNAAGASRLDSLNMKHGDHPRVSLRRFVKDRERI